MQKCLLPRPDSLPFLLYIFPLLICQTLFFFFLPVSGENIGT
ncbi:hypothetical protein NC652_028830 [Populus alba x Populus x berolinensis]|nr:hypothetical protein NC652_028830 [Populus alba x Populus x berolinensis]